MKNIDIKSLIIGALFTSTIFLGVAATSPTDKRDDKQEWKVYKYEAVLDIERARKFAIRMEKGAGGTPESRSKGPLGQRFEDTAAALGDRQVQELFALFRASQKGQLTADAKAKGAPNLFKGTFSEFIKQLQTSAVWGQSFPSGVQPFAVTHRADGATKYIWARKRIK